MATRKTTKKTTAKKTTTKKVAKPRVPKPFKVSYQKPSEAPELKEVLGETTFGGFKELYNLSGYTVSLNGDTGASDRTPLSAGDVIRVGVKTSKGN